ncbi:MAG: CorA family divalent cation transporter, partial [Bacteriovoracaceae bacterium]
MSENSIPKVGSLPGSLEYTGNLSDVVTEISVVTYDHDSYRIEKDFDLKTYQPQEALGQNTWVRFVGLSDVEKISVIGKAFELDELTLEDILSVKQRPGMNYSQNQIFSACKMFYFEKDTKLLRLRQISFILKAGVLLTFEERAESCISTIFDRLKYDQNKVRRKSIDYLFYL